MTLCDNTMNTVLNKAKLKLTEAEIANMTPFQKQKCRLVGDKYRDTVNKLDKDKIKFMMHHLQQTETICRDQYSQDVTTLILKSGDLERKVHIGKIDLTMPKSPRSILTAATQKIRLRKFFTPGLYSGIKEKKRGEENALKYHQKRKQIENPNSVKKVPKQHKNMSDLTHDKEIDEEKIKKHLLSSFKQPRLASVKQESEFHLSSSITSSQVEFHVQGKHLSPTRSSTLAITTLGQSTQADDLPITVTEKTLPIINTPEPASSCEKAEQKWSDPKSYSKSDSKSYSKSDSKTESKSTSKLHSTSFREIMQHGRSKMSNSQKKINKKDYSNEKKVGKDAQQIAYFEHMDKMTNASDRKKYKKNDNFIKDQKDVKNLSITQDKNKKAYKKSPESETAEIANSTQRELMKAAVRGIMQENGVVEDMGDKAEDMLLTHFVHNKKIPTFTSKTSDVPLPESPANSWPSLSLGWGQVQHPTHDGTGVSHKPPTYVDSLHISHCSTADEQSRESVRRTELREIGLQSMKVLGTRYLRLTEQNIKDLEKHCLAAGLNPNRLPYRELNVQEVFSKNRGSQLANVGELMFVNRPTLLGKCHPQKSQQSSQFS